MNNSIQSIRTLLTATKKHFLQDFLVILKQKLQKCFLGTTWTVMLSDTPVAKWLKVIILILTIIIDVIICL